MNNEDIIRMAREAGASVLKNRTGTSETLVLTGTEKLERFAALVAAHERKRVMNEPLTKAMWDRFESEIRADEREVCAKVCEEGTALTAFQSKDCYSYARNRAAAIRARGEK